MNYPAFVKVDRDVFYNVVASAPEGERYEYVGGRIVQQQAGGTLRHARISSRFLRALEQHLDAAAWIVAHERGIEMPASVRFADVSVEPAGADPLSLATWVPALIVEVLSPTSSDRDLNEKPGEYLGLASLQAYVIASQSEAACLVWVRDAAGHFPADPMTLRGIDAVLAVPSLSLAFSLADIYRDVV